MPVPDSAGTQNAVTHYCAEGYGVPANANFLPKVKIGPEGKRNLTSLHKLALTQPQFVILRLLTRMYPTLRTRRSGELVQKETEYMMVYKVVMSNMAPPLNLQDDGLKTPPGIEHKNFDELPLAQSFAEEEKGKWHWVSISKMSKEGGMERLEHYQDGRKINIP